ncbi:uncharacterized protein LAESUDRAFT_520181 [Laetiporus sulphureus 93-53]|uniref:tRNA(Ile)-lysidine synthetase n=1 Tax=Laetiporus sulphureus 93-53 TaxID=1314785 RepID=A0A165G356_9APHY|nr:uncharacterized protein LAESUDRAFT_520181 [Laetiporus sulphureus 93-53]KZT09765.1 hypothetical protein LAESUDRAFT_520181 [Laetiporus sulphureus 93-53]
MHTPISSGEFLQLLQRCIPPGGWPSVLAVGNSGGPDSTCLLYLLSSLKQSKQHNMRLPFHLISLHVNHALQASSDAMAECAAQTARSLNIDHHTASIPWGTGPYPPLQEKSKPFERIARNARYQTLFQVMTKYDARAIAYGHHADDQVETAAMRLAMGSGLIGAGAMRPVRRWGMGEQMPLAHFGPASMSRWIVRPLLTVPKDRILATCEKHGLQYVTDPTNFQPSVTIRNAIRHTLAQEQRKGSAAEPSSEAKAKATLRPEVMTAIEKLRARCPSLPYAEALRESVRLGGQYVEQLDTQVTNYLSYCSLPSPPSTVLLNAESLHVIPDMETRIALVRRILRYCSPRLWGSIEAEAKAHRNSLERIVQYVWDTTSNPHMRTRFSSGSNVVWVPGVAEPSGVFRLRHTKFEPFPHVYAWRAQRAPPQAAHAVKLLVRNVTNLLVDHTTPEVQVLWDTRFLLTFHPEKMPQVVREALLAGGSDEQVVIQPTMMWYAPQVVWKRSDGTEEVLADYMWDGFQQKYFTKREAIDGSSWVKMEFIRTLGAI